MQIKPANLLKTSRKYHKWLMLFLGVQFVIWSVTGTYMVFFDIDYIHGDSLVVNHQSKINPENINYSLRELYEKYPDAKNVNVEMFIDKEVYRFKTGKISHLVDAKTGEIISPINEQKAREVAQYYYTGSGRISDVKLITENPPFELSARRLPAWQINFDNFSSPSLYISAQSGTLVGKRHEFWRLFDWMFRFHIMDYENGESIDNSLLFWVVLFALLSAIFGLILTYYTVLKPYRNENTLKSEVSPSGGVS